MNLRKVPPELWQSRHEVGALKMSEIRWRLSGPDVETVGSFVFMLFLFQTLYQASHEDYSKIRL
jgi:hypothetical protein